MLKFCFPTGFRIDSVLPTGVEILSSLIKIRERLKDIKWNIEIFQKRSS